MSVTHADRIAGYSSATHFLNVDLDIRSKHDLQPLVKALGRRVIVLYVGRERRKWSAHLEVARNVRTADAAIWAFWNTANVRGFMQPNPFDFVIRPKTVRAVSLLGAQIVLTIYALKTYSSTGAVKSTDVAALSKK